MDENKNQPLDALLKMYWSALVNDLAKTNDKVGEFDDFRDSRVLVSRLKAFSNSLVDFVAEVKEYYSDAKYHALKGRRRIELVKLKMNPRSIKERANIDLSLSMNLVTRKSFVFLNSKIGLSKGNYVSVAVEDIQGAERIVDGWKTEGLKQKKLAEIAAQSIEAIIPQMMAKSGYEWNLECGENKRCGGGVVPGGYYLCIKMKRHKMVRIALNQKNFANKIPEVLNVVKQIEQLMEQVPYAVDVLNYGPGTHWFKGTEYV